MIQPRFSSVNVVPRVGGWVGGWVVFIEFKDWSKPIKIKCIHPHKFWFKQINKLMKNDKVRKTGKHIEIFVGAESNGSIFWTDSQN